jgi:hypothetical protein
MGNQIRNQRTRELVASLSLLWSLFLVGLRPSLGQAAGQSPAQGQFQGSVPTGQATGTMLELSLKEAFDRALKYNLGLIESDQSARAARAARLRSLSALLPNISTEVSATIEQINLKAFGLSLLFPASRSLLS